jgi:replicative DNA helicase
MMARQLRPNIIFIDAAYLLQNHNQHLGRWERVTENIEFIKSQIAEALDIPVVISYQVNREGGKKKGQPTLEDIAYTDAIGQISSCVMGLFEDDDIESMMSRKVTILKGRNGESGEFRINWNFDDGPNFMDFTEVSEEQEHSDLMYE